MAQLAIRGHATRGSEVIELLEMLGGINTGHLKGERIELAYYIEIDKSICCLDIEFKYLAKFYKFTLEQFLEKFPYKVGDRVTLDKFPCEIKSMSWEYDDIIYYVKGADFSKGVYSKDKDLQPYKEETETMEEITIDIPKGYEFAGIDDNRQQVVFTKIGYHYPNTYKECCKILGYSGNYNMILTTDVDNKLFNALYRLKVCRDAYWKLAGEQMGLGKPWKSNPSNEEQHRYAIYNYEGNIAKNDFWQTGVNAILTFPTEEMRDAFYGDFKELIEQCKELL